MRVPSEIFQTQSCSVHWLGQLSLSEIEINYNHSSRLILTAEEQSDIERTWQELKERHKRVEDLPLYRLLHARVEPRSLSLDVGLTGYKEYQGTNIQQPSWAIANPSLKMANPIGLSAVAITGDNIILMQARSDSVGEYGRHWHVTPSGHIHPPQSLSDALTAELQEELGVDYNEVEGASSVIGLIVNKENRKPELTILVHLKPLANDILTRTAPDRWEYERLQPLKWKSTVIGAWLKQHEQDSVPFGHAAILLAGRVEFGDDWMNKVLVSITSV